MGRASLGRVHQGQHLAQLVPNVNELPRPQVLVPTRKQQHCLQHEIGVTTEGDERGPVRAVRAIKPILNGLLIGPCERGDGLHGAVRAVKLAVQGRGQRLDELLGGKVISRKSPNFSGVLGPVNAAGRSADMGKDGQAVGAVRGREWIVEDDSLDPKRGPDGPVGAVLGGARRLRAVLAPGG